MVSAEVAKHYDLALAGVKARQFVDDVVARGGS